MAGEDNGVVRRLRLDGFLVALVATVAIATLLPARGPVADGFDVLAELCIALLFFLHGARVPREALRAAVGHVRLHAAVLATTFVLFPLLGLLIAQLPESLLSRPLALGMLFLCCLPSTVQSSIAFTSMARGNVVAAVCSATLSNLVGVIATPLLVSLLLRAESGGLSFGSIRAITFQLLLPFALGQLLRPWVGPFAMRHHTLVGLVDRGSILLVVFSVFSEAVTGGLWERTHTGELAVLLVACSALLGLVLALTTYGARAAGLRTEDAIVLVFCGSKKSLVTGVPMAGILFPAAAVGTLVLPLMVFHQLQLMVCAVLARRYARRPMEGASDA